MAPTEKVFVDVEGRDKTKGGFTKAKNSLRKFAANAKKIVAGVLTGVVALGAAFAILGSKIFDIGANAAETASKFRAVFGDAGESLNEFGEEFRKLAGLTTSETQAILANAGAIAQGLGFATQASADLSAQVLTLAGDLASFNNLNTADVAATISKALVGETESLKALGIVVKVSEIQQQALINTGKRLVSQLTNQEKATAALQLVTERAGAAVGDLDATSDSAANQARQAKAAFRQLAEEFSAGLLPALTSIIPLFRELAETISEALPGILEYIQVVTDALGITDSVTAAVAQNAAEQTIEQLQASIDNMRFAREGLKIERDKLKADNKDLRSETPLFQRNVNTIRDLTEQIDQLTASETALEKLRIGMVSTAEKLAEVDAARAETARMEREEADIQSSLDRPMQLAIVEGLNLDLENLPGQLDIVRTQFQLLTEDVVGFTDALTALTTDALANFKEGFIEAFEAIGAGDAVFASLSKAIKRSIADSATAQARVQVAQGVSKIAAGIFPPNPAAFISAGKHFAAAALFATAAGAIGGTRTAAAGGGVGGRGPISDRSIQQVQGLGTIPPAVINIQGSFLDVSDPRQADALAKALSDLSSRRITVEGN